MDGGADVIGPETAADCLQDCILVVQSHNGGVHAVGREPVLVYGDCNFFLLLSEYCHVCKFGNLIQPFLQRAGVLLQLVIAFVVGIHCNQNRRDAAEFVKYLDCKHSGGEKHARSIKFQLDFCPDFILLLRLAVEVYIDVADSVLSVGIG